MPNDLCVQALAMEAAASCSHGAAALVSGMDIKSAIARVLAEATILEPEELEVRALRHKAIPERELAAARREAYTTADRHGVSASLRALESRVREWSSQLRAIVGEETGLGMYDRRLSDARRLAGPAIIDAVVDVALSEKLSARSRNLLSSFLN